MQACLVGSCRSVVRISPSLPSFPLHCADLVLSTIPAGIWALKPFSTMGSPPNYHFCLAILVSSHARSRYARFDDGNSGCGYPYFCWALLEHLRSHKQSVSTFFRGVIVMPEVSHLPDAAAIGFPFVICLMIPLRIWLVPKLGFSPEELAILDQPVTSEFVRYF